MSLHPVAAMLAEKFRGAALAQFEADGFCVIENALPVEAASAYLAEIQQGFAEGRFAPNKVEFVLASGSIQLTKNGIFECDLHAPKSRNGLNHFTALVEGGGLAQIADVCNERCPSLALISATSMLPHTTTKLQVNTGGGAFPWHTDNTGNANGGGNKRKLTLAVYLTPESGNSIGGELVCAPFLGDAASVRVVPPAFNTVVLFRADVVNHRTLPTRVGCTTRCCFTVWFDSDQVNRDEEVNLRAKQLSDPPTLITALKGCNPLHRSLTRAVYDEEYREALCDCFSGRDQAIALKLHEAHVGAVMGNAQVRAFVELLRKEHKQPLMKPDLYRIAQAQQQQRR